MVSGLPNENTRCYLNAVMQAARACGLEIGEQDELYHTLHLEDGPQDAHETWLRLVDHLEKGRYPKETFYGTQRETCISKSGREERVVDFGCIHDDTRSDEYITTPDGFTLKQVTVLTVPKVMAYVHDSEQPRDFPPVNEFGKTLRALIVHGFGHYVAIVKDNDEWFLVNDMHVEKIETFQSTLRAYMAFYV